MMIRKSVVGKHIMKSDILGGLTTISTIDQVRFLTYALIGSPQLKVFANASFHDVDVARYAEDGKIRMSTALKELIDIVKSYQQEITINIGDGNVLHTQLIHSYIVNEDSCALQVCWNSDFANYISGEQENGHFTYYHIKMSKISSAKRYALYELMQKQAHKGIFTLSLKEIREVCNLSAGMYDKFSELNRQFIQPTVKDIEKILDITIEQNQNTVKGIKKVQSITFQII